MPGGGAAADVLTSSFLSRFHVKFGVTADVEFIDQLRVCGATEALGNMDPEKGLPLQLVRAPVLLMPSAELLLLLLLLLLLSSLSLSLSLLHSFPRSLAASLSLPRFAHRVACRRSRTGWATTGRRCAP